jgi:hypothetical protein
VLTSRESTYLNLNSSNLNRNHYLKKRNVEITLHTIIAENLNLIIERNRNIIIFNKQIIPKKINEAIEWNSNLHSKYLTQRSKGSSTESTANKLQGETITMACSCFYNRYWNNRKKANTNKYTNCSFDKKQERKNLLIVEAELIQLSDTEELLIPKIRERFILKKRINETNEKRKCIYFNY